MIGDSDPEDAWEDGDPIDVRLVLLARIVTDVEQEPHPSRRAARLRDVVRLLRKLAEEVDHGLPVSD